VRSAMKTGVAAPTNAAICATDNCRSSVCTLPPKV
jgi:hypothetical protein